MLAAAHPLPVAGRFAAAVRRLFWLLVNALQAVFTAVWTAGWISVAIIVTVVTRHRELALVMARRVWAPGLLAGAGARLTVHGLDRVDFTRPHLFVANHRSTMDIPTLFAALPVSLHFIARRELRSVPFLGSFIDATGMVFIDREDARAGYAAVERTAELLSSGHDVLAFPSGSRRSPTLEQRFKSGAFAAAIEAGVGVVPVAILGTDRVLPAGGFHARPGEIQVVVGESIPTDGLGRKSRRRLARQAETEVKDLYRTYRDARTT